jgi:hypothetical protein
MSWWKKLFGGKVAEVTEATAADEAVRVNTAAPHATSTTRQFPVTVEIIPGELSARVYLHEISATGGRIPCWLYVSDGLGAHQHREVVFTLRRESGEADAAFPEDPLRLFGTLYQLAAQGKRVTVGGCTELGARRFFEHHLLYADAQPLGEVTLPPGCLTALLINDDELRAVREFGCTRVLARMGHAANHYPFPTWSERGRRGLSLASTFEQSLLSKIGIRISGQIVVSLNSHRITVGIQRELHARLRDAQADLPDAPIAFLALRDPAANACLVWEPGQREPTAISPPGSDGSRVCGAYAIVLGEQSHNGGKLFEDGFAIELTDASWAEFRRALFEGTDLVIPATGGGMDFALAWRDDIYADVLPRSEPTLATARGDDDPDHGPPSVLPGELDHEIVLLMPQDHLGARVDADALAAQIHGIGVEVVRLYARGEICVAPMGVFIAVKPNRRVKIWVEGIEGSLSAEDAALIERRASAVTAPEVRGAIAYVCAFPRKGTNLAGPPPLPQAWKEAARTAGKPLMIPDGMLAAVWPD